MSLDEPFDELLFAEASSRLPPPATRVDRAHVRADELVPAELVAEPIAHDAVGAECTGATTAHQVRLQAAQLATHLQRQQSAVDHRESELNARMAAMENQIRSARLWLDERHAEIAAQKADLERRERELADSAAAHGDHPNAAWPAHDQNHLDERAAELDRREAELEAVAARLARRLQLTAKNEEIEQAVESLDTYREKLERAEAMLSGQQAEIDRERGRLADSRAAFAETMDEERQKLAAERQRSAAENERLQKEFKRQADELAARQAALERMRSDVARAQQEALEVRLATEELWARLCGSMAPAALAQSLAQTRLKLAEEQRLERTQLAAERAEVQALAAQLADQHARLVDAREEIQTWVKSRREELERTSGQLAAGQRQLEHERATLDEKAAHWQRERARLEQEIRRLLRQAGGPHSVAAA
jgi:predicted  nucleic acid-binding Zn-ribbon protein